MNNTFVINLLYNLYYMGKNHTYKPLDETSFIYENLNSTYSKTVSIILSRNTSNHSKAAKIESSILTYVKDISSSLETFETERVFESTELSKVLHIIILILYSILIFISLTSNPLLIYVLLIKRKTQLKLIDVFVINLSISDFFLTIFNIPLCLTIYFSGTWLFGTLICKLGTYSTSSAIYINILTMAYISVDRYFAVTRPLISNRSNNLRINAYNFDYATKRKIYIALAVIWFVAFIISIPQFIFTKIAKIDTNIENEQDFLETANKGLLTGLDNILQAIDDKDKNFNSDYFIKLPSVTDDFNNGKEQHFTKFGEGLMNRCTMDYPNVSIPQLKISDVNIKFIMVMMNFICQYLLPSLVILFFYGKIIYHLYLNLNIEGLFQNSHDSNSHDEHLKSTSSDSSIHHYSVKDGSKRAFFVDLFCKKKSVKLMAKDEKLHGNYHHQHQHEEHGKPFRNKGSVMRVEGINRTYNLKKSIKIMVIIITSFLISWLPIHLYRLITTFHPLLTDSVDTNIEVLNVFDKDIRLNGENCTKTDFRLCLHFFDSKKKLNFSKIHNRYLFFFFHFLSMSSVCYNPIVYFWLHKKFRKEVQSMLSKICSFGSFIRNKTVDKLSKRRSTNTTTSSSAIKQSSETSQQKFRACKMLDKMNGPIPELGKRNSKNDSAKYNAENRNFSIKSNCIHNSNYKNKDNFCKIL